MREDSEAAGIYRETRELKLELRVEFERQRGTTENGPKTATEIGVSMSNALSTFPNLEEGSRLYITRIQSYSRPSPGMSGQPPSPVDAANQQQPSSLEPLATTTAAPHEATQSNTWLDKETLLQYRRGLGEQVRQAMGNYEGSPSSVNLCAPAVDPRAPSVGGECGC